MEMPGKQLNLGLMMVVRCRLKLDVDMGALAQVRPLRELVIITTAMCLTLPRWCQAC